MIFEKKIVGMYKGMMYTRCDGDGTAYYFSSDDFPGLKKEKYDFKSSMGHDLKGYLYFYENPTPCRIIVFDHGFGGGHRSYMKEIEKLASRGYLVLAYDHTGCMESGGENPCGMSQSLRDLNDCISKVKGDERFAGYSISVVGHSWGGFSTLNISALHPEISHAVVLSGFVSVKMLVDSFFSGPLSIYRKAIMRLEKESNPDFVDYNGVESLKKSRAKVMLVYSDNDRLCARKHFDLLKKELCDRQNTEFLLVEGKGHNPNYTKDAVLYLAEYQKKRAKGMKKHKLGTPEERAAFIEGFDWNRMTKQDEAVWDKIFAFLEK